MREAEYGGEGDDEEPEGNGADDDDRKDAKGGDGEWQFVARKKKAKSTERNKRPGNFDIAPSLLKQHLPKQHLPKQKSKSNEQSA